MNYRLGSNEGKVYGVKYNFGVERFKSGKKACYKLNHRRRNGKLTAYGSLFPAGLKIYTLVISWFDGFHIKGNNKLPSCRSYPFVLRAVGCPSCSTVTSVNNLLWFICVSA